jgi:hypothetical protein
MQVINFGKLESVLIIYNPRLVLSSRGSILVRSHACRLSLHLAYLPTWPHEKRVASPSKRAFPLLRSLLGAPSPLSILPVRIACPALYPRTVMSAAGACDMRLSQAVFRRRGHQRLTLPPLPVPPRCDPPARESLNQLPARAPLPRIWMSEAPSATHPQSPLHPPCSFTPH